MQRMFFPLLIVAAIIAATYPLSAQNELSAPVYGTVFTDFNGNNAKESWEPSMPHVRIEIVDLSGSAVRLWAGRSDAAGVYRIDVAADTAYQIHAYCPTGDTGEICAWRSIVVPASIDGLQLDIPMPANYQTFLPTTKG